MAANERSNPLGRHLLLPMCGALAILVALVMAFEGIELSPTLGALLALGILLIALPYLPQMKIGVGPGGVTLETLKDEIKEIQTEVRGDKASLSALLNRVAAADEVVPAALPAPEAPPVIETEAPAPAAPGPSSLAPPRPMPPRSEEDPLRGQFGGSASARDRILSATIAQISGTNLGRIALKVTATGGVPLSGSVTFHLHPTFVPNNIVTVPVDSAGEARLEITSYGAFTVGAVADNGATQLELNLVDAEGSFEPWRSR